LPLAASARPQPAEKKETDETTAKQKPLEGKIDFKK